MQCGMHAVASLLAGWINSVGWIGKLTKVSGLTLMDKISAVIYSLTSEAKSGQLLLQAQYKGTHACQPT